MQTDTLYALYSKELRAFIRSKVADTDLVNDLLQDTFVKAHLYGDTVKDPGKIKQWLFGISRNLVTDHFRKQKLKLAASKPVIENDEPMIAESEMTACVSPMINKLPPAYRDALIETELHGLDQKSLAEKLQISYSGAKSRVQRAREMLKNRLMDCCKITADKYGNIVSHTPRHSCSGC